MLTKGAFSPPAYSLAAIPSTRFTVWRIASLSNAG